MTDSDQPFWVIPYTDHHQLINANECVNQSIFYCLQFINSVVFLNIDVLYSK